MSHPFSLLLSEMTLEEKLVDWEQAKADIRSRASSRFTG